MCSSEGTEAIRIACIGDSVTKGTGLGNPESESYPAQLAAFLQANGYPPVDVRNFGEGGAGLLKRGCNAIWDTDQYGDALVFDPDVLIIHLGTNDSREEFWNNDAALLQAKEDMFASFAEEEANKAVVHGEFEFEQDLEELVEIFSRMPARPEIVLCTPVPLFHSNGWLKQAILHAQIAPRIRGVAARKRLRVVELLDSTLAQRHDLFPDGVHPNAAGAAEISALIGQVLLEEDGEQDEDRNESVKRGTSGDLGEAAPEGHGSATESHHQQMVDDDRQIVLRELQKMRKSQSFR